MKNVACRDCGFHKYHNDQYDTHQCRHPKIAVTLHDKVTGYYTKWVLCSQARSNGQLCDNDAKLFEQKIGFFKKIFGGK